MRRTLEFKMISVVVFMLLIITISTALMSFSIQRENLFGVTVMIVTTLILFFVLTTLFWLMLRKLVISPVKSLGSAAKRLSEGDLSFPMEVKGEDEMGRLAGLFEESLRSVGKILGRVREISDRIARVADDIDRESRDIVNGADKDRDAITAISGAVEGLGTATLRIADSTESLASSVEETSDSMDEMVSSVSLVNDHMHELSAAVESTSSSIQEMSASIKQVASNAEELATASQETLSAVSEITSTIKEVELTAKESARLSERATSDAASLGMASIEKTKGGMEKIRTSVERAAEFIQRLGGRSDEIGKILTVIDEVTDQTTLLALNAAILAAQAGEHGKGFSVVADEIKDLAERTAFSTQEIGALIQSVQQEVKHSVEAMQEGLTSVEEGFTVTMEAEEVLRKILDGSKKSSEIALSIERSTTEQSKAAKLVAEAMERVRNMTEQIAKSTLEQSKGIILIMKATEKMRDISRLASKATDEQTATSRQISQAMGHVSERSQQISHSLSHHKTGTKQIVSTIDTLKKVPLEKRKHVLKLSTTIKELRQDAQLLRAETERFTLSGISGGGLKLGVVPLESPSVMFKKFGPLVEYIARKLGRPLEMKVAVDFDGAVRDLGQNITQFSIMGPATYIEGHRKYGTKVLVKARSEGRHPDCAVIVTRAESDIRSIHDLKGRSFAFGAALSASGHIIPRSMLKEEGVDLGDLGHYDHIEHFDDIANAVLKGNYDAGVVIESVASRFNSNELRPLRYSGEIPGFNVCCSSSLDSKILSEIKSAFLTIDGSTAEGALVLRSMDEHCTGFVEANDSDYDDIRVMMSKIGML